MLGNKEMPSYLPKQRKKKKKQEIRICKMLYTHLIKTKIKKIKIIFILIYLFIYIQIYWLGIFFVLLNKILSSFT